MIDVQFNDPNAHIAVGMTCRQRNAFNNAAYRVSSVGGMSKEIRPLGGAATKALNAV